MDGRRRCAGAADRGQAMPLLAIVVMAALVAVLVVAHLGGMVVDRARARTAADAAALAGVDGGRSAAEAEAVANDATLEAWVVADGFTQVTVRVGRARATARARPGRPGREAEGRVSGDTALVVPGVGNGSRVACLGPTTLRSMLSVAGL